ncbi:hypothetical protein [Olsenella sp. HMSC062G07]|uniref:hypothetical protein n=1 Tax=Olsenella sp. HMSC062G07 TaxID=1739330 RepID=UPI0008A5D34F|nr:hypothetical protein [Olsenella sp. HMSC062G07]OFK25292.1 hypothetical protein HMPREF2826_03085 [Olsenella sp. HMSC062G07]
MTIRGRLVQRAARRGAVLLSRQILAVVLSLAMIQWPTTYALARPAAATEVAISTEVAAGEAAPSTDTAADSADTENSAAAQDETPVHTWKFDLAGGKLADSVGATDPTKIDDVTISGDDEATLLDTGIAADVSNVKDVFATGELVRDGYVFRGWAYDTKTTASDGLPQTIIPAGAKVSGLVFSYDEDKDGTTETTVVPDKFVDPQEGAPEGSGVATLHAVWEKVAETAASAQDTGAAKSEAEPATSAEDQSSAEASAATTSEGGEADTQTDSSKQEEEAATPSDAATNAATLSEDVIASSPTAREALREGTANAGADVKDIDQGAGDDLKAEVTTNDTPAAAPVQRFFSTLASAASGAIGGDVTSADGTTINSFEVKWVTPDSHNNDDKISENLVFAPYSNASINLRGKVSFSLSGEHDYQPGDISFTLPGHIFTDRSDKPYGSLSLPLAEAPSTKTNFNWSYDSGTDTYTITNTGTMSAASSVEIEFGITDVTPSEVVDSKTFGTINSTLFVTTNAGSGLHATAGGLTAQVNTQEVLGRASKIYQSYESTDDLSRIPDEVKEKYPDEKKFLLVTYYTYAYHSGCTYYTLTWKDTPTDSFGGTPIENGDGIDLQDSYRPDGNSNYHYVTIAYPFSQFEAEKHYTLTNSVEWTLTQTDPNADGTYASSVQQATATCNFYYSKPTVKHPGGRFDADKVGEFGNKQPDWSLGDSYPTALNSLSAGKDVSDISYKSSMIGYVLPYLQTEGTEGTKVSDFESSKSVHMQIEDGKLDFADTKYGSGTLSPGVDYEFTALGLDAPKLLAAVEYDATLLDASKAVTVDGRAVYDEGGRQIHGGSYGIGYTDDADLTHSPDFVVQAQVGGAWKDVAAVSWKTGSVFYADGSAQSFTPRSGVTVSLPAGTTSWRYGADVNIAGIREAVVHPKVKLHPTSEVRRLAQDQIADSTSPAAFLRNTQSATATQGDEILFQQEDAGADELRGYDVKIAAVPSKDAMTDPNSDVNYEDSNVTLHYSAKVELQSDIADKDAYESAVANGDISSQTSGVWYDLLPKGVVPNLSTIDVTRREVRGSEVSSADGVKSVRTIDNYKGTGRTLLVVGVSLVPTAQAYLPGNSYTYMYEDVPQIRFDATYSFNDSSDWGTDLHNVIAFEGGSSELAQREGYQGEPDSPDGKNTVTDAATTFVDEAERSAMTDLDPASSAQNVVYAGASTSIQKLNYYTFSLSKQVDVNNEGSWGTGVGTADQPNANAKNAWAGGPYSYRLAMVSGENSSTSNMVIYDELENYVPTEDKPDVNGKRWRGALVSVDVSQLRAKGVDAKVYYSSKPDIDLANDGATGSSGEVTKNADSDLANTSVWSLIPPDDLSRVTAIAVDASTATDGSPFVLASYDTATVRVNMVAPSGEDAAALIDEDAHAYNSAYMSATGTNSATGA